MTVYYTVRVDHRENDNSKVFSTLIDFIHKIRRLWAGLRECFKKSLSNEASDSFAWMLPGHDEYNTFVARVGSLLIDSQTTDNVVSQGISDSLSGDHPT